jgi:hypothetical protein
MPFDFVTVDPVRARKTTQRATHGRENLVEQHAKLDVFALLRGGHLIGNRITVAIGDQQQTILVDWEAWRGDDRLRPNFLCPRCARRCRRLHQKSGTLVCRLCAGYDYASRHTNRFHRHFHRTRRLKKKLAANPRCRNAAAIRTEIRRGERALAKSLRRVLNVLAKHGKGLEP